MGSYYSLHDGTYVALLEHLGLKKDVPPFRRLRGHNSNYHDDRVLDILGTDIRYLWSGFPDLAGPRRGSGVDAWGVRWEATSKYSVAVGHPLSGATMDEIDAYPWPKPEEYVRVDELASRAISLRAAGTHAIAARGVNSYGPFEQASVMRGREQFLVDLVENPELVSLVIHKVTNVLGRLIEIYLDVVGHDIDIMELPGDDYGGTTGLMFSPTMFCKYLKPALAELAGMVKAYRESIWVAFHSDGVITPLLGHLAEVGIDIIHPLEPLAAVDLEDVKRRFGDHLTFMGAIDIKEGLTGTVEKVEDEVRRRIRALAPGGGYIAAPTNALQEDVPPQNIVALFRALREYGTYPICI